MIMGVDSAKKSDIIYVLFNYPNGFFQAFD